MPDDSICLLDWEHAGFSPYFHGAAAVPYIKSDFTYGKSLLQAITNIMGLANGEQECVNLLK